MKSRLLLIMGLIAAGLAWASWRADFMGFGQDAPPRVYNSPIGSFTLPTVEGTAGTLGSTYKLARLEFGFASNVPQVGDLSGDTGNGFSDRYDFENLNAFAIPQSANEIGDLDSLDPNNRVSVGGRIINPGFRFVHIGRQAFVWRVGGDGDQIFTREVTVFPSIDHLFDPEVPGYGPKKPNPPVGGIGNAALEALEFTVWGTNDRAEAETAARTPGYFGQGGTGVVPNNKWFRATLTRVFAEGFKDYNGRSPFAAAPDNADPSPQEGDDFASRWQFRDANGAPASVKFVAVYANRTRDAAFFRPDPNGAIPGNVAQSNECEIDAVGFEEFVAPPTATISGRVINDANSNFKIDANEQPIPGVTIRLTGRAGSGVDVSAETQTNSNGEYIFREVLPGSYRVTEINLPGYLDTAVLPGANNTAIDLNNIGAVLAAGDNSVENNFLDALPPDRQCVPACYNSADMWLLFDGARQAVYDKLGGVGGIFILSLNRGALSDEEVVTALSAMDTAKDHLGRQFVAAQLNAASYPQSIFNRASCFYLGPNVIIRIPGDPRLIDLIAQARTVFNSGDDIAIETLANYLELINNITSTTGILCPFVDP
ncbi:MAG: SdrD B-like domain-containing protein [Blastocatellia bacterium]